MNHFIPTFTHSLQRLAGGTLSIGLVIFSCLRFFSVSAVITAGDVTFYISVET